MERNVAFLSGQGGLGGEYLRRYRLVVPGAGGPPPMSGIQDVALHHREIWDFSPTEVEDHIAGVGA